MPQSTFMIVAPIRQNSVGAIRELLASMNSGPGIADPENTLVPLPDLPTFISQGLWSSMI